MRLERPRGLLSAARKHHDVEQSDAAIILVYTLLDILGALGRPASKASNDSSDFKNWLSTYVMPKSRIGCTVEDLWGARCGILHSLDEESDLSRGGKARIIGHIIGEETAGGGLRIDDMFKKAIHAVPGSTKVPPDQVVFVHVRTLLDDIESGIARFEMDLITDTGLAALVEVRLKKAMPIIVRNE